MTSRDSVSQVSYVYVCPGGQGYVTCAQLSVAGHGTVVDSVAGPDGQAPKVGLWSSDGAVFAGVASIVVVLGIAIEASAELGRVNVIIPCQSNRCSHE